MILDTGKIPMTALVTIDSTLPALPVADIERAADFARLDKSAATRAAYKSDFAIFTAWCSARGVDVLPATPGTVVGFLAAQADAGHKAATIGRRVSAIKYAHGLAGYESPTGSEVVKSTLHGIRRTIGTAPARKAPAVAETIRAAASMAPDGLKGIRDKAILTLGFALAARRSELVALDVADLEFCDEGLRVTIRKSKTDQTGEGATIAVCRGGACCPVKAIRAWLTAAGITEGPIFRPVGKGSKVKNTRLTAQTVCDLVKAYAGKLGLPEGDFGAHSLRSGFLTSAARRGASIFKMKDVSRHKSMDVLQSYVRDADLFQDHAGAGLL